MGGGVAAVLRDGSPRAGARTAWCTRVAPSPHGRRPSRLTRLTRPAASLAPGRPCENERGVVTGPPFGGDAMREGRRRHFIIFVVALSSVLFRCMSMSRSSTSLLLSLDRAHEACTSKLYLHDSRTDLALLHAPSTVRARPTDCRVSHRSAHAAQEHGFRRASPPPQPSLQTLGTLSLSLFRPRPRARRCCSCQPRRGCRRRRHLSRMGHRRHPPSWRRRARARAPWCGPPSSPQWRSRPKRTA